MKQLIRIFVLMILLNCLAGLSRAATDGTMTFSLTTVGTGNNYSPRHVLAIWVVDANTNFVERLRINAASRRGYLYKYVAASDNDFSWTSGATLNTHGTRTVTWDCRDLNGVLMPDGYYSVAVEFTERNGQGPWTDYANSLRFYKGTNTVNLTPANIGTNFTSMSLSFVPIGPSHDLAVKSITPTNGMANTNINITVQVTNASSVAESFTVTLSNMTMSALIGTANLSSVPEGTRTNVVIPFSTTGLTNGTYVLRAFAGPVVGETFTSDNSIAANFTVRTPQHDLDMAFVSPPVMLSSNVIGTIALTVTNVGDYVEDFPVTLTDLTEARLIGSNQIVGLSPYAVTNFTFSYTTTNVSMGNHVLQAVAYPVAGETSLADNTNQINLLIAMGLETNLLVNTGSVWRYNDLGLNLGTLWREADYFDGNWSSGKSPLGYGNAAAVTVLNYGTNDIAKFPTYYFRQTFNVDATPTSLLLRLRKDDGAVIYINGQELMRANMPVGVITYTNYASSTTGDPNAYTNYVLTNLSMVALGVNQLAVEVHQGNAGSSDIMLDLALSSVNPTMTHWRDPAVAEVVAQNEVFAGDLMHVAVTVTNRGNFSDTFTVVLKNMTTGLVVGSNTVNNLAANGTAIIDFDWKTLGVSAGTHSLQAYTIFGGQTNLAGTFTTSGLVAGSGFGSNSVNAAGSVGGRASVVAVDRTTLLVGEGATLDILNCTTPGALTRMSSIRLPGIIEGIVKTNNYAYVACGNAGVHFVDLTNVSNPVHRATLDMVGHAYAVKAQSNYLYVAAGRAGLRVINIANPAAPFLAATYATEGPARNLWMATTRVFLMDEYAGLLSINVATPTSPALLGTYKMGSGVSVVYQANMAYVADGSGIFRVLDVTTATNMFLTGAITNLPVARALAISGTTLYLAAGDQGVITIDAADPFNPYVSATNNSLNRTWGVAAVGTTLYVADGFAGTRSFNITTPTIPTLRGNFFPAPRAAEVAITNGYAYVASGELGLRIYNITNVTKPLIVGTNSSITNARSVAVSGPYAYVGEGQSGFKIITITNPAATTLAGTYFNTNIGCARDIVASGSKVVLSDGGKLWLVDVTLPNAPTLLASNVVDGFAFALATTDTKVLVAAGGKGLLVYDISGGTLNQVGVMDTYGLATGVAVFGNRAYLADGQNGWMMVDISNPSSPQVVGNYLAAGPVTDVAASGVYAFINENVSTVRALNVSKPLTPVIKKSFAPLVRSMRLAAGGLHGVAAEDEAGMIVFSMDATSQDVNQDGLPDTWEQQIVAASLATNGPIKSLNDVNPNDDFDGDGLSNFQEYLAGTAPTDAASTFMASQQAPAAGQNFAEIRWLSVAGKTYSIYQSTNLANGFSAVVTNIPATPPMNTYTNLLQDNNAFYILGVE